MRLTPIKGAYSMEIFDLITASVKERKKFLNFKLSDLKSDMHISYLKVFEIGWMNNRKRSHYKAEYNFSKIGLLYDEKEGRLVYKLAFPYVVFVILLSFIFSQVAQSEAAFGYGFLTGIAIGAAYLWRMVKIHRSVFFRETCGELIYEMAYDVNEGMKEGLSRVDAMAYTYKRLMSGAYFKLYPYKQEREYYLKAIELLGRIYFGYLRIQRLKGTMSEEELYKVASNLEKAIIKDHLNSFELSADEQEFLDIHKKQFIDTHIDVATSFYEKFANEYDDRHYKPRYKKSLLQVLKLKSA